jgi:hypothetical protein
MAFDRSRAERSLVEVLDLLNGDRRVGMGVRLPGGVIATSCRCLPRPLGEAVLPDPDAPTVLVLVRVRIPESASAASAIVTTADPCAGLALLEGASLGGLTVPDELNPVMPVEALISQLQPAVPALSRRPDGAVLICTGEHVWVEGSARSSAVSIAAGVGRLGSGTLGAPVFGEDGRVLGVLTAIDDGGLEARMAVLADHLPGWAFRAAEVRAESG